MKKRILIAGYYGYHNIGDEAILGALLDDLRGTELDLEICVLSGDPADTKRLHRVNAIDQSDIQGIIEQARNSDCLIVGGGGVFQDYWGADKKTLLTGDHAGIPFYSCLPLLGWLLEKPVLLYAVGVGPLFSQEARELTRLSFELATSATVRDRESQQLLVSLGLAQRKIQVSADSAFNIAADIKKARRVLQQVALDANKPIVGVCLRNWEAPGSQTAWQGEAANALDAFVVQTNCSLLFIPFQDLPSYSLTNDVSAAQDVISEMKQKSAVLQLPAGFSPEIVSGILSQCELVVGMRYHSIAFAASANVPAVGLSYDVKVSHLMENLGLGGYVVELSEVTRDRLLACMNLAWSNRQITRRRLPGKVGEMIRAAQLNRKVLGKLLEAENPKLPHSSFVEGFFKELNLSQSALLADRQQVIQARDAQLLLDKQAIQEKDQAIGRFTGQIENQARSIDSKDRAIKGFTKQIENQARIISFLEQEHNLLQKEYQEKTQETKILAKQLNDIYHSTAWKLIGVLWGIRKALIPKDSLRERVLRRILRLFKGKGHAPVLSGLPAPRFFQSKYKEEDNTLVTLYTGEPARWSDYSPKKRIPPVLKKRLPKISLIACAKDEADYAARWLRSVLAQTRPPEEIVVVDTGSNDGTLEILDQEVRKSPIPITLISSPGANIAAGRNQAIAQAKNPLIAVLDFGATPDPEWLAKMLVPFQDDPKTCLAAGIYRTVNQAGRPSSSSALWQWNSPHKIWPQSYLPPGGSAVFQKAIWQKMGGYPEWLTLTGEDTYFDLELKKLGGKWAFVPDATVAWCAPEKFFPYLQKLHNWAIGDGEAGIRGPYYWKYAQRVIFFSIVLIMVLAFPFIISNSLPGRETFLPAYFLGILVLGIVGTWAWTRKNDLPMRLFPHRVFGEFSQLLGFIRGVRRRPIVEARRYEKVSGLVFVLSGVPIDDTGGGARCAQLALEFLRRNFAVVYLNRFPKCESRDLDIKITHPNLFTQSIAQFDFDSFARAYPSLLHNKTIAAIVEHPIREYLSVVKRVRQLGGISVYDLIDAWDTALGGQWYSPEVEKDFIAQSQVLVATAPVLVERLEKLSNRKVHLVPNAVNSGLFDPRRPYPQPADMPRGSWTGIYIGALWGDWFDWTLLERVAETYPNAAFAIIGDYQGQCKQPPQNLHFLGLKRQRDLPAYLAYADVAIIPWKVNEITQAASPLKVYEYLSMRLPVVAPCLKPLNDISGVYQTRDQEDFIGLAGKVSRNSLDQKKIAAFVNLNNWNVRVNALVEYIKLAQKTAN